MSTFDFSLGHDGSENYSLPVETKARPMPLQSDIVIDVAKFQPSAVSEQTIKFKQHLLQVFAGSPKWYEVGAEKYRQMRLRGETALPPPKYLEAALDLELPSREAGRTIPCRLVYPSARKSAEERKRCRGTVLHIHGGGWVLGDQKSTDHLLLHYADAGDLAVLSVGYRLAPENPFPKGPEDCVDVAEYLVSKSEDQYGGPLRFIGGESAGAHLSLLVTLSLLTSHPTYILSGLLLHFGCYDLSLSPSARLFTTDLILNRTQMLRFLSACLPDAFRTDASPSLLTDPSVSPYYADLEPHRGRLPSALFTCGTDDALLDDSVNMGTRWMMFGADAVVKIYPGCPHAFIGFPIEEAERAVADTKAYIVEHMSKI